MRDQAGAIQEERPQFNWVMIERRMHAEVRRGGTVLKGKHFHIKSVWQMQELPGCLNLARGSVCFHED